MNRANHNGIRAKQSPLRANNRNFVRIPSLFVQMKELGVNKEIYRQLFYSVEN
ncbi:hypothetical protein M3589_12160 [Heyndrickxia oleronia]|uniref:hypothetical protein n=1 Tax=Heyndrickxia oleronia TaxID=38875 RepID=UPI00203DFFF1|nr:hypothetical protein [Heyndrickxia oleronia]MCM3238489.1 hypothetical protein [Heyndrickxia oleronia]